MAPITKHDKPPGSKAQRVRKRKPDARLTQLHAMQTYVHRLHQEVESLKLTRQLLLDRSLQRADQVGGSYERVVREYFAQFRFNNQPAQQRSTEDFLRAIMDENVNWSGPDGSAGIDQFLDMVKAYSAAFGGYQLSLVDLKVFPIEGNTISWQNGHVTVTGWGKYSCYITPTTIEMLFPHTKKNHALVAKLLGQHISGVCRYDFVFNTASNRVIATSADLNFVPVFMDALKNPREVALLLDQAHITPEYEIGSQATAGGSPRTLRDAPVTVAREPGTGRVCMAQLLT
jgi:hypothetical protein